MPCFSSRALADLTIPMVAFLVFSTKWCSSSIFFAREATLETASPVDRATSPPVPFVVATYTAPTPKAAAPTIPPPNINPAAAPAAAAPPNCDALGFIVELSLFSSGL